MASLLLCSLQLVERDRRGKMSRGPGRVERAIKAAFEAEPTRVFTTEYLCTHVYAGATKIEKKHRVSLIRAAKRVLQREHSWRMTRTHMPGAALPSAAAAGGWFHQPPPKATKSCAESRYRWACARTRPSWACCNCRCTS